MFAACSTEVRAPRVQGLPCWRAHDHARRHTGLPSLKVCQYQFQRFLEFFLPRLAEHFERSDVACTRLPEAVGADRRHRLQIPPELYATEWFMTLFTYRGIPLSCAARIWDVFLVDGWKAVHRVALAILYLSQVRPRRFAVGR